MIGKLRVALGLAAAMSAVSGLRPVLPTYTPRYDILWRMEVRGRKGGRWITVLVDKLRDPRIYENRSKYLPHQGERECARRA